MRFEEYLSALTRFRRCISDSETTRGASLQCVQTTSTIALRQ